MAAAGPASVNPQTVAVFLNFPYDRQFVPLYLAYITGVCSFGLVPPSELDLRRPRTPRMNMPFELGLTVMAGVSEPEAAYLVYLREGLQTRSKIFRRPSRLGRL